MMQIPTSILLWLTWFVSFYKFWIIENKLFMWCVGAACMQLQPRCSTMPWHRTEDTFASPVKNACMVRTVRTNQQPYLKSMILIYVFFTVNSPAGIFYQRFSINAIFHSFFVTLRCEFWLRVSVSCVSCVCVYVFTGYCFTYRISNYISVWCVEAKISILVIQSYVCMHAHFYWTSDVHENENNF